MNYIGKIYGDYKVIEKVSKDKYIFACLKCGEEKEVYKTTFYRKPRCQKTGGRSNAVRINYKGRLLSASSLLSNLPKIYCTLSLESLAITV